MHSVHRLCGKEVWEAIIICVAYGETSTKDMMHLRRNKGQAGVNVNFSEEMLLNMKEATFLANSMNKQRFINMLGSYLEKKKCKVYHAPGDSDLFIVEKAVESSIVMDTVLVGKSVKEDSCQCTLTYPQLQTSS